MTQTTAPGDRVEIVLLGAQRPEAMAELERRLHRPPRLRSARPAGGVARARAPHPRRRLARNGRPLARPDRGDAEARDLRHQRRRPRDHRPRRRPRARHHGHDRARALRRRGRSRAGAGARRLPPDRRGRPVRALRPLAAGHGWRSAASSPACAPASWASAGSAARSPRGWRASRCPIGYFDPARATRPPPTGAIRTPSRSRAKSDILFLCAAGGPKGANPPIVDRGIIEALGPRGVFVNISRGWLVDEPALVEALSTGRLGAAGLDVFFDEPKVPEALLGSTTSSSPRTSPAAPRRRCGPWASASPAISSRGSRARAPSRP